MRESASNVHDGAFTGDLMSRTRRRISGWVLAATVTGAVVFFYFIRGILTPFLAAAALAYILSPLVRWIHLRSRTPRWLAASAVYVMVVAIFGTAVLGIVKRAYASAQSISDTMPEQIHRLLVTLFNGERLTLFGVTWDADQLTREMISAGEHFIGTPQVAVRIAGHGIGALFLIILTIVLLFYFLVRGPQLATGAISLVPPEHRQFVRTFAARANPLLQRYLTGLIAIVIFTSVVTWIGVGVVFQLPHPVLLAVATGLLELIPVAGPTASAGLLGGTAVLHGGNAWTFAGFALFCLCLRLMIDQIVGPIILGKAVRLPPVAVIFAFLAGGALFGVIGVFLAIPTVAVLKLLLDQYYEIPVKEEEKNTNEPT